MMHKATTRTLSWLTGWAVLAMCCASTQAQTPTYWKQRQFFVPYQATQRGQLRSPIAKVELLVSRTGTDDWATLETAEPNVQGFSYHAPEDGEYWFALRHLDQRGEPWPSAAINAQMHMVIDTQPPELSLEANLDVGGEVVVRYEARDLNLQSDTLILEIRLPGRSWNSLRAGEPDISQASRLVGRVRWRPPQEVDRIEVRAAIADRAGHRGDASTALALQDARPSINGPSIGSPTAGFELSHSNQPNQPAVVTNPFASRDEPIESKLPSYDWPSTNRLPSTAAAARPTQSPPPDNPYSVASRAQQGRTAAQLVADGQRLSSSPSRQGPSVGAQSLQITPLDSAAAPPLMDSSTSPAHEHDGQAADSLWSAPSAAEATPKRVVNSQTFDIEYDLQSVGPWGVAKVELWGTADNGQTWRSFGIDPDNRTPARVTVPEAGTFGFRILVDGANAAGATPPQSGDAPELTVSVDLQPPVAELLSAQLGRGNLSDHLLLRWSATDTNLEDRPIALFYSSYPNGPWSTIASGLENTGRYTWRIERHVPGRFYLRLEARDVAGNLTTFQTPSPVTLSRQQPTGRLKGVRPINSRD